MIKWWLILDALILSVFELDGVYAFHILVVLGESLVGRLSHDENFIHWIINFEDYTMLSLSLSLLIFNF